VRGILRQLVRKIGHEFAYDLVHLSQRKAKIRFPLSRTIYSRLYLILQTTCHSTHTHASSTIHLLGKCPCIGKCLPGQMSFCANVLLGKCLLSKCLYGQMSFWANILLGKCLLGKCLLGKCLLGKCLSGKMSFGANDFWANVFWANVVWANVVSPPSRSSICDYQFCIFTSCNEVASYLRMPIAEVSSYFGEVVFCRDFLGFCNLFLQGATIPNHYSLAKVGFLQTIHYSMSNIVNK
jgi:hypothetical protein